MSGGKTKTGAICFDDYEAEEYLQSLEGLSQKLMEQYPGSKFDRKALGHLLGQIRQFMEDAFGIKALPPRHFPKIPAQLFKNVQPGGPLHVIVSKFHEAMTAKSLKRVDFTNPSYRNQFRDIYARALHELIRQDFLKWPKVYMHPSCGAEQAVLASAITSLKGEVAQAPDAPGVTHHVHPFGPRGDPDDGVQYMRNLGKRGDKALVHWWYYPDSYDEYVPADSAPEVLEPDKQADGPWKVYTRWVKDSVKYNEWMNPIDYEVDDSAPAKDTQGASADPGPPASTPSQQDTGKRKREDTAEMQPQAGPPPSLPTLLASAPLPVLQRLPEVAPGGGIQIAPGMTRQILLHREAKPPGLAARSVNLSQGQSTDLAGIKSGRKQHYKVPMHAAWFKDTDIHPLEQSGCPEFFASNQTTSHNPETYRNIRTALINKYSEDVSKRLTFSEAQKCLTQDTEATFWVWRFLDQWGIINSLATDSAAEVDAPVEPPEESKATSAATLAAAEKLFKTRPLPSAQQGVTAAAGYPQQLSAVTCKDVVAKHVPSEAFVKEARYFCYAMPGVDCTNLRYHCTKIPDVDLCAQAYANGQFPAGCTEQDFIRIDQSNTQAVEECVWTDQDTLLLLEGLELYSDNWADIADHVGTKSQVQCILHFLRLPIEDEFLDQLDAPRVCTVNAGNQESTATAANPVTEATTGPIPFGDQGNPVMAQAAFLAAMVSPKVAAAAAQQALEVLLEDNSSTMAPDEAELSVKNSPAGQTPLSPTIGPPSAAKVKLAAAAALAAGATKARLLADEEEREVQKLIRQAVTIQAQVVEQRLKQFAQLQAALDQECVSLTAQREGATADRLKLHQMKHHLVTGDGHAQASVQHQGAHLGPYGALNSSNPMKPEIRRL